MARVVIFGTGDVARIAHYYFERDSPHEVAAFTVDRAYRSADAFEGLPLVDFEDVPARYPPAEFSMFVALGYSKMNRLRADKYDAAKGCGYELVSYVSSRASVLNDGALGDNCFILEDNTIQPFVTIGHDVIMWSGNHIGHDAVIGDHCFISSHVVVSGFVKIGAYSFCGVNATFRDRVVVGERTLIGAGAVILKDTEPGSVYITRPATRHAATSDEIEI